MPNPADILAGLTTIAARGLPLAIVWHVLLAAAIIALLLGRRPGRRSGAVALSLPLLSVAVLAWLHGNPFNGIVFVVFAALLAALGLRLPKEPIDQPARWQAAAGALMIAFAWFYPHFVPGDSWLAYFYAPPLGLIPCPTLSMVVGFALSANGFSSRGWSRTLVVLGLFYGLFGAFRLGVGIDAILLAGVFALGVQSLGLKKREPAAAGR